MYKHIKGAFWGQIQKRNMDSSNLVQFKSHGGRGFRGFEKNIYILDRWFPVNYMVHDGYLK